MRQTCVRRLITGVMTVALVMAASAAFAADTKLKVGLLPLALHQLPLMMAKEKGLFAANSLDVDFIIFKGGSEVAPALLNGNIDVAQGVVAHPIKLGPQSLLLKVRRHSMLGMRPVKGSGVRAGSVSDCAVGASLQAVA